MKHIYHEDGTHPGPSEVFVFGSNLAGRHGAGAAKAALAYYGAVYGEGVGRYGRSFGIPTKNREIKTLPLFLIKPYVEIFLEHARSNPDDFFFITRIGCGLAGYTNADIAPMFKNAPQNCSFAEEWMEFLEPEYRWVK